MAIKKLTLDDFKKLRRLVYRGATPLIFTQWRCAFEGGDPEDLLGVLACYQNEDGGFGHALEANSWNPNSTPYVTDMAISCYLNGFDHIPGGGAHPVIRGILKYLASGDGATGEGWLGINGVPSNNDYSHSPWFHYDPDQGTAELDPQNLARFILKYGESGSALYEKALRIAETTPADRPAPDFSGYDPAQFLCWLPLPTDIVDSPDSPLYPEYRELVEAELDGIVDRLREIQVLPVPGIDDSAPDWLDNRQVISCYPSTCGFFIMQMEILRRFGRLDFELPVR